MKFIKNIIISMALGIATFFIFANIFEASLLVSLVFSFASFLGGLLITAPKNIDKKLAELEKIHGITPEKIKQIITDGKSKIKKMKEVSKDICNKKTKEQFDRIINITEKIYNDFEQDPKDVKAARQFLNYYIDTTIKIVSQYAFLCKKDQTDESLQKFENTLSTIEKAFEKQLAQLYEDDFLDLDTEISVLEKTLKADGMH